MVAKVDLLVNQTWNPYKAGELFRLTPLPNLNPTKDFEMGSPIKHRERATKTVPYIGKPKGCTGGGCYIRVNDNMDNPSG